MINDGISVKKCPTCGKMFAVPYPHMWAYKRGTMKQARYYCTWSCLRAVDKKGNKTMDKNVTKLDRIALAKTLLEEIEAGRSPLKYMESLGYANPSQAYMYLKQWVRKNDPQLGALFPTRQTKKKPEIPEQVPAVKVDGAIRIETPEAGKVEVVETPEKPDYKLEKPLEKIVGPCHIDKFLITALKHPELGEFYYDKKFESVDWRTQEGDEVSMCPSAWNNLLDELPHILRILGAR